MPGSRMMIVLQMMIGLLRSIFNMREMGSTRKIRVRGIKLPRVRNCPLLQKILINCLRHSMGGRVLFQPRK